MTTMPSLALSVHFAPCFMCVSGGLVGSERPVKEPMPLAYHFSDGQELSGIFECPTSWLRT